AAGDGAAASVKARGQLGRGWDGTVGRCVVIWAESIHWLGRAARGCPRPGARCFRRISSYASNEWWICANRVRPEDIGWPLVENTQTAANAQLALLGWVPSEAEPRREISDAVVRHQAWLDANGCTRDLLHESRPRTEENGGGSSSLLVRAGVKVPTQAKVEREIGLQLPVILT